MPVSYQNTLGPAFRSNNQTGDKDIPLAGAFAWERASAVNLDSSLPAPHPHDGRSRKKTPNGLVAPDGIPAPGPLLCLARSRHLFPIEQRPNVGAALAANLTDEPRLEIG